MTRNLLLIGSCLSVLVVAGAGCYGQSYGAPPVQRGVTNMQPENTTVAPTPPPAPETPAPAVTTPPSSNGGDMPSGDSTSRPRGTDSTGNDGTSNDDALRERGPATAPTPPTGAADAGGGDGGPPRALNGGEREDEHRARGGRDKDADKKDKDNKDHARPR